MKRTIITHDIETAVARVSFEHNGVRSEDTFQLDMVIPSTRRVFDDLGMPFDEAAQLRALDHLTARVEEMIETGALSNPPEDLQPVATPEEEPAPAPIEE